MKTKSNAVLQKHLRYLLTFFLSFSLYTTVLAREGKIVQKKDKLSVSDNKSPVSNKSLSGISPIMIDKVSGAGVGFEENFNDNLLTKWYVGSYGITEQNQTLKIIPVKSSVWDGFGLSFPEINIRNKPFVSLKIKSNFDFNISLAVGKVNGKIDNYPFRINTIGIVGAQEVVASNEFQEYSFDFTGVPNNALDSVSNLHFVLNPLTRDFGSAPDKEILFDDIKIGDLALHSPAMSVIQDQVFTINTTETASRVVNFRNVTDGTTDNNAISIIATSSNQALIPNPQVIYTSPKRIGTLLLQPNVSLIGESVISVAVSAPNTTEKVMTFKVKVVPNAAPTMKILSDLVVRKGEKVNVMLDDINDGNAETTQEIQISGQSIHATIIPEINIIHDSTNFTGSLSFTPDINTAPGSIEIVKIKLKDNGGIALGGIDSTIYSFNVSIYDEINHKPTLDSIGPKSVKALAGLYQFDLKGLLDSDNNTQHLSFNISSSSDTILNNLTIGEIVNGVAPFNYELTGKTGRTTVTIQVTDDGGKTGNNGNQTIVRSFVITAVPAPVNGLITDYQPYINNISASGISSAQKNSAVEILSDGTVHISGTVMQQTYPGNFFDLRKLTGGKELDISANKYVSFKFKGASTNRIEAPDNKLLDKTKIYFRLVDDIEPGQPGSGYNISVIEQNISNDDLWHEVFLDFSGLFYKNIDGGQTDSTRICRLMLDINDFWFQQIKGDYFFKDIKIGDKADRPVAISYPTVNSIPNQVIYKGLSAKPILLTGITDGKGKQTANLTVSTNKPELITGINIGNIVNGTAQLSYSIVSGLADSAKITLIANNISVINAVPDTVTFNIYVVDTTAITNSTIDIDFSKTYQTIAGIGCMLNNINSLKQVQAIKEANLTVMRLTSTGEFEPVNDNTNPNVANYSNFNREALPTALIRNINENTNCHKFFYTPWSPPGWMKQNKGLNPDPSAMWATNNTLKPEMYEEFAEYLVAICKTIKEEAGVELYAISLQNEPTFNEPYSSCQYTGEQFRDMLKIIGPRFDAENIHTRIMMPEDISTQFNWVSSKINPANADQEARKYIDIMAVHLYDPDGINVGGVGSSGWKNLLALSKTTPAEGLWMTETSGYSNVWEGYWGKDYLSGNPQFFPGPLDFAGSIYTAFKVGSISGWTDFDGAESKAKADLLGSVFRNYSAFINPGSVMVDATSSNNNVLTLAFKNVDNSMTSVLLNTSKSPIKVILKGSNVPQIYRSFVTQNNSPLTEGPTVTNGSLVLAPRSITTLSHNEGNLAPTINPIGNVFVDLAKGDSTFTISGIGFGEDVVTQNISSVSAVANDISIANVSVVYNENSPTASLRIKPVAFGTTQITVKIKDDGGKANGGVDSTLIKFFVKVISNLNHAPTVNSISQINISEDADSVYVKLSGISDSDKNTQLLTFSVSGSNNGLIVSPRINYIMGSDSAELIFKPLANANGTSILSIVLTDNGGDNFNNGNLSAKIDLPVTVLAVNDAPTISAPVTSSSANAGVSKRFPISIEDGDPEAIQTLSYILSNSNPEIVEATLVDNHNNTFTLNTKGKSSGVANLKFIIKDSGGIQNGGIDSAQVVFVITILSPNGIEDVINSQLSLYPNPADDFIFVTLDNDFPENVLVRDAYGHVVLKEAVANDNNKFKLSISNLVNGLYFITVNSKKQSYTLKFVHR